MCVCVCVAQLGRALVAIVFYAQASNDSVCYPLGLGTCWLLSFILRYIYKDVIGEFKMQRLFKVVGKWLLVIAKIAVVGSVWMLLPPLLIGYLIEATFVIPVRTSTMETPQYYFFQCWAIGLIVLKIWTR